MQKYISRGASRFKGSTHAIRGGQSGSENIVSSNANIGENPMLQKLKGSFTKFIQKGKLGLKIRQKSVVDG